jgi:fatty-acyl-CoA synthase
VLLGHPDVIEAAVIGRPDPRWQEVPVAYVVRRPGAVADAEALKAHVARELARFTVPRAVMFVESLPRNALGKVQHFRLREGEAARRGASGSLQCSNKPESEESHDR